MELLIGAAAVFGLLYLLGVEVMTLLSIVQMILTVMSAIFLLFFVFCDFLLLFSSKRYAAQLVGIQPTQTDENGEQKKGMMYKAAYYIVDGEQLRNWFPAETLGARRIYSRSECFVRIACLGKKRLVFDRHSMLIVISGTVLMGLCSIGLCVYWLISLGLL